MGIHVLDPNYKVFNRHLLTFLTIGLLYSIMVMSSARNALGDIVAIAKSLTTYGVFIQVTV